VAGAVLFDFAGVFTLSPFSALAAASVELGLEPTTIAEILMGPYDADTDHPWHRLERGEITLADARVALLALAAERGLDGDPLAHLARLGGVDEQRQGMIDRVRALRTAGVRTALVTNNVAEFGEGWRGMIPVDELFDVVVDSCRAGVRKPDPRIFQVALEALGVGASDAVFLDDFPGNVAAAEAVGLHGIVVGEDRLAAMDELEAFLGLAAEVAEVDEVAEVAEVAAQA
jgi:putative hydrolase of the HAD superfamily